MAQTTYQYPTSTMSTSAQQFTTPDRPLTWLITGCSSGLGLALARHVLASGHHLIATSRNPAKTPDLVREVEEYGTENGQEKKKNHWLALDVDDKTGGPALIHKLEEEGIAIDVLVNNAGVAIVQVIEQLTTEEIQAQMETVCWGPVRLAQAVLPHMRKRRFGVIVYISSGAGLEAQPALGLYGAAKATGDAITKTLAREVAPFNIRALYVSLGSFHTNMSSANRRGEKPLPDDYTGTTADTVLALLTNGQFKPQGDPKKAAKAIFEVASAQGVGKGREAEVLLPLGSDSAARVGEVRDKLTHALDVFAGVYDNVKMEQ